MALTGGGLGGLGGPNIYPSVLTWLGLARELTAGNPVLPVWTHPLDQGSFEPEDTPKFLQDKAIRGAMTDLFYETLGVESAAFSFGGPNFLDTHGYFFDNVFGDLSSSCSTLSTSTTVAATLPVGATSMTVASTAGMSTGGYIQIGTAASTLTSSYINEVVQITSMITTAVTFANNPLRFAHTAATPVAPCVLSTATTFTHRFAALNSQLGYGGAYGAQPPTHTFTDQTNVVNALTAGYISGNPFGTVPTNTYGARQYAFSCLKNIDFSGNAEQLLGIKMAGDSFLSTPVPAGTPPILQTTGARPIPNWAATVNILGQTVPTTTVGEFMVSFKRQTQVYWTVQGSQQPFVIARGPLTMDGTIQYDPTTSEIPLDIMLLNAQGPMSINLSNANIPNSGPLFNLTFTASQVANVKSKINRSKDLVAYGNSFEGVGNATDVGGSGGLGPGTITLVNTVATY
jgi:hypothetical protein